MTLEINQERNGIDQAKVAVRYLFERRIRAKKNSFKKVASFKREIKVKILWFLTFLTLFFQISKLELGKRALDYVAT